MSNKAPQIHIPTAEAESGVGSRASTGSESMARKLVTEHMLRWKSALEAAREAAPCSGAACWVAGYVQGLQQALDWMPSEPSVYSQPCDMQRCECGQPLVPWGEIMRCKSAVDADTDKLLDEHRRMLTALRKIRDVKMHNGPMGVGVACAMQDIAQEALSPNAEVSDGGPLTHESPAAQSRRSLH